MFFDDFEPLGILQRIQRIQRIHRIRWHDLLPGAPLPHAPGDRMTVVTLTPSNNHPAYYTRILHIWD